MIHLPKIQRLTNQDDLLKFSQTYFQTSGLPIPEEYLCDLHNRVYSIFYRGEMIGGFILAKGTSLRTLEVFAQPLARHQLYKTIGDVNDYTEITCFWMDANYRRSTALNTVVWLSLAYCLRRYGNEKILFGTCSASLARLYGVTPKSQLIHKDKVNGKSTFIFQSHRSVCLKGFMEIIRYKLCRTAKIKRQRQLQPLNKVS